MKKKLLLAPLIPLTLSCRSHLSDSMLSGRKGMHEESNQENTEHDVKIEDPAEKRKTALHEVVIKDHDISTLEFLLSIDGPSSKIDINALDKEGKTALDYAKHGSETAKLLNKRGAFREVDRQIIEAVEKGDFDALLFAIARKGDLSMRDRLGNNLLHTAAREGHLAVAELLVKKEQWMLNDYNNLDQTPLVVSPLTPRK